MGLTVRCPQEEEFRWLLHAEVHAVLRQLQDILKVTPACANRPAISLHCSANCAAAEPGGVLTPTSEGTVQTQAITQAICVCSEVLEVLDARLAPDLED